jgi:hypothetical protein
MSIAEPFRRRGLGAILVQELKRVCYEMGSVPAGQCNVENAASQLTLAASRVCGVREYRDGVAETASCFSLSKTPVKSTYEPAMSPVSLYVFDVLRLNRRIRANLRNDFPDD